MNKPCFNSELRVIDLYGNFVSNAINFVKYADGRGYNFFLGRVFLLLQACCIKEVNISKYKLYNHFDFLGFSQKIKAANVSGELFVGNTNKINIEGEIVEKNKINPNRSLENLKSWSCL